MVIKNVSTIVGKTADIVDLADEVDLKDEADHLSKHQVATDDVSVLGEVQQLMEFNDTQMIYNNIEMNYAT